MSIENKLEQAVVHLIDKSIAGIDTAVDFLSAELPVYIEQLLTWYALQGIVSALICLVATATGVWMMCKVNKGYTEFKRLSDVEQNDHPREWFHRDYCGDAMPSIKAIVFALGGALFALFGGCGVINNIWEPLQIMVAPHVWLVEYAAQLKAIASN